MLCIEIDTVMFIHDPRSLYSISKSLTIEMFSPSDSSGVYVIDFKKSPV